MLTGKTLIHTAKRFKDTIRNYGAKNFRAVKRCSWYAAAAGLIA